MQSVQIDRFKFTVRNFNNHFLLLKCAQPKAHQLVGESIYKSAFQFIDEVIASEAEIYLKLNQKFDNRSIHILSELDINEDHLKRDITLPVCFSNGKDWHDVVNQLKLSKEAIIQKIESSKLTIAMFGFIPGFTYLSGLDPELKVKRKSNPEIHIPANSFAIAGDYAGIYSLSSPGGWQVIGELVFPVIDMDKENFLLIKSIDQIKITAVDDMEMQSMRNKYISLIQYNGQA